MSVDPTEPITRPETLPTAEQDLDPDEGDIEDAQDQAQENTVHEQRPPDWDEPGAQRSERPEDWNEPPASDDVLQPNEPTPLSDDLR